MAEPQRYCPLWDPGNAFTAGGFPAVPPDLGGVLEQTRARHLQPYESLWALGLGAFAAGTPLALVGLLHEAINTRVFMADWYLTIGVCLLLSALTRSRVGAAGGFVVLAGFSTPGLIPWHLNLVYNLDLSHISLPVGVAVLAAGVLLTAVRHHTTA